METEFDLHKIITSGIQKELDFPRALIASRLLRIMMEENPKLQKTRTKLRDFIMVYVDEKWSSKYKKRISVILSANFTQETKYVFCVGRCFHRGLHLNYQKIAAIFSALTSSS